jgi:OPA family glycerol-3-phosphate transporter-like MFS transporter
VDIERADPGHGLRALRPQPGAFVHLQGTWHDLRGLEHRLQCWRGLVGVIAAFCAGHFGWPSAFFAPGIIASLAAVYLFWRMVDTPQSVGLPPVEEHKNEYPPEEQKEHERELSFRELFVSYILTNNALWLHAFANFFVYIAHYSMLDWGPTFLKEAKGATLLNGGVSTLIVEFSGAAGMLTMGWISDRFDGRRGAVSFLCMIPLFGAFGGLS